MAHQEIDSFVKKFRALCQGGRNATLTLSSRAGKAVVNLSVDLGVVPQDPQPHHHPQEHSRNGPAQQRRRERRAAARQTAAEEAEAVLPTEEKEVLEMADIAKQAAEQAKDVKKTKDDETEEVTTIIAKQAAEQAKDVKKTKDDETEEVTTINEVHKKIEEINDEVVPNSEYESTTQSKDDPPNDSNPVKEHPPPVRDRTLGGIDYYSLSYDDPIFKNGYN